MNESDHLRRSEMYSILLVDDERALRESIEQLVNWEDYDFHLLGTAENGLDALQLMKKIGVPDVVITDIKMPVMDGIEFAERLREEYPTIKIVFLSGYDEFQYAVEGIKLNVVSYMLKPVSRSDIENCLETLQSKLDEEVLKANDLDRIRVAYNKNIELMKNSFLNSLITENYLQMSSIELDNFLKTHQLEALKHPKILMTVRFVEEKSKNTPLNDKEFKRFSLYQLLEENLQKYVESEVFLFSTYVVCILTGEEHELGELSDIITKDIIETVRKLLQEEVVIGVSEIYQKLFQTKKAYRSSIAALDYANHEENVNVTFIADVENTAVTSQFLDDLDEGAFLLAIKTNDSAYIASVLTTFLNEKYYGSDNRVSALRSLVSIIYVNCMRALRETIGEVDEHYNDWYHRIFELTQVGELAIINDELSTFLEYVMADIQKNRAQLKNSLVLKSLTFLEEHYNDPDTTLKSISQYLHVSPSYFSAIFKKETGKSFIDTLTEMKMNKAKELVITTDQKMFEIAFACGYEDQHYFSYSFKKYFGLSPTKMRKQNLKETENV